MSLRAWYQIPDLTLEQAVRTAARYLDGFDLVYGHGTDNATDEASWLILEAMGLSPLEPPDYNMVLTEEEKEHAISFLRRRAEQRVPAAYITGRTWFAGLEFLVDERALVPRSPLAEPIMQGFSDFIDPGETRLILDLCTGGGCIAIACAYAFADAHVDALDISEDALALAKENLQKHAMQRRVRLIQSDLFEAIKPENRYDLIISNPPYVDRDEMDALGEEFRKEPGLGLAAGTDGLDLVRRILAEAADHLTAEGILVCEVGNSAAALEAAYPELPFMWLEFEHGGDGVFVLTHDELVAAKL